jgi:hypothetical protein
VVPKPVLHDIPILAEFSLMLLAIFLGSTISHIIREPNLLLPVAMFAAAVDFWNVYHGWLGQVVATKPEVVSAVTVHMPTPVPGIPYVMIGMGDFVFMALYMTAIYRFDLNTKGTFWLTYILVTVSMLIVVVSGAPLPALVPIAVAVIAANARRIKLKREELLATIYVGVVLLALLVASGVAMSRHKSLEPQGHSTQGAVSGNGSPVTKSPNSQSPATAH